MRELIRPGLFWVVRIGLFLSVVAWFIGQSWQGGGTAFQAMGFIDETGIVIAIVVPSQSVTHSRHVTGETVVENYLDAPHVPPNVTYSTLHIVAAHYGGGLAGFGIKHWFLVTIFATFYAMLKWVYRKRGRGAIGDV